MSIVYDARTGQIVELEPIEPGPPPTPEELRTSMPSLTARQLRLGLLDYQDQVEQIITDSNDRALQIEWEYATTFERLHPAIVSIGAALDLTPEQIDAMWIDAANT